MSPVVTRREWVSSLMQQFQASLRSACRVAHISRSTYRYQPKPVDDSKIQNALLALTERHPCWGFSLCYAWLRTQGYSWNHKRVHRVYVAMGLSLRRKAKKRLPTRYPQSLTAPHAANSCWSMDFMSDSLSRGRRFRTFNVMDDYNREILGIDINTSLPTARVTHYLDQLAEWRGYPQQVRVDNGPEFTAQAFQDWAKEHNVRIDYIEPGSTYQNGFIERFNRTYRTEVLDAYWFDQLQEVREFTDSWMHMYNYERPHQALGMRPPKMMA